MAMKKIFSILMVFAVTAMSFNSCQKEKSITDKLHEGDYIYSFVINPEESSVETKATLGSDESSLFLKWENGDTFGAFATNGSSNSNNRPSTVLVSGDTYTLKVASTVEVESGSVVYAYFPYNSGAGSDKTSATIKIDPVQTQKSTGFDASVMPMVGEPYTTTTVLEKDEETAVGEIHFANLGSIIEFNIFATSAINEQIKSVEFNSTSGNLAGNFTLNLTTVDFSDASTLELQGEGTVASVKTTLDTPVAIPVSTTTAKEGTKVYMSVAPGDYTGTIVVTTTGHTYTFNVSSSKTFNRSKVKRLNANLSTATPGDLPVEETWEVITDASDFTEGTYVIVSSDKTKYLVNDAAERNPASAAAHWDASGNLTSVTSDAKWIATTNGSGLQFASYANSSNLLWMSTSTAQGVTVGPSSSISGAAKVWTLVANESLGGESGYLATTGNNRYLALYTNGTWRGYTINSKGFLGASDVTSDVIKAAIFYKLGDSRIALETPVLTVSGTEVSWSAITNAGSYLVTIGSDEYTINTTSVDLDDYSLSDGEYTVTVVAVPSNTTLYMNSAAASTTVIIGNPVGTLSNPYTVSGALSAINALNNNTKPDAEVYIQGTISTVTSFNGTYKSITYYISEDGSTTNQLEVYSGKGLNGADFSDITDLAVGDKVIIKGYLYKYYNENNQTTTPEIFQSSQIVSINKVTRYTVTLSTVSNGSISASATTVAAGGLVKLTATPNSGYSFDGWTVTTENGGLVEVAENQFTMPASNVTVSATFIQSNAKTVTYTQSYSGSGHTVATTGDAPTGSSCSWTTTYTNSNQLTAGKSMTYTITGFDGKKITGLALHMKTNASKGKGSVSMKHGDTEFGTYSVPVIGSTYEMKEATVTATTIGQGETVTVVISATENSVYCDYITLTYE